MLVEFSISNFLSFRDKCTFSMLAGSASGKMQHHIHEEGSLRLLKSAAIFGPNASGKSNLLSALITLRNWVVFSTIRGPYRMRWEPFRLDADSDRSPSEMQIVFLKDGARYRYGVQISSGSIINKEWLYIAESGKRESRVFERSGQVDYKLGTKYAKELKGLPSRTTAETLFISVATTFNSTVASQVTTWFELLQIGSAVDLPLGMLLKDKLENVNDKKTIINLLRAIDVAISDFSFEIVKQNYISDAAPKEVKEYFKDVFDGEELVVKSAHGKYDKEGNRVGQVLFDFERQESRGTNKVFSLSGLIIDSLRLGIPLIVDELDASLHPLVTRFIVSLFNSDLNTSGAQLVFTTHESSLLPDLRNDQVWLTEKGPLGASGLYSLLDFRLRNDASLEKAYIEGRVGAVPIIRPFELDVQTEQDA